MGLPASLAVAAARQTPRPSMLRVVRLARYKLRVTDH